MAHENQQINLWVKQNQFGWYAHIRILHSGLQFHTTGIAATLEATMRDVSHYVTEYISALDKTPGDVIIEGNLPERTPAPDVQSARAFLRRSNSNHPLNCECYPCEFARSKSQL